jgi:predicted nucleotidyltransferase
MERNHCGGPGVDKRIIYGGSSGSEMWGYGLD